MKLIYLELEEEITSVIDKVQRITDSEVTLVIPKGATLTQSIVNLKLLRKHAGMQGKAITIVTGDPVGVNLAKRAGLQAKHRVEHSDGEDVLGDEEEGSKPMAKAKSLKVKSYKEIEAGGVGIKKPVQTSSGKTKKHVAKSTSVSLVPRRRMLITIIIILIVLAIVGAAVYLYLPRAIINILLQTETITNDVSVKIEESVDTIDEKANVVPGIKYEVELSKEIERNATGEKDAGRKAQGTVTIYNYYQTTPRVIVPSRFQSADGKVFRSTESVTLPGYADTGGDNKTPGMVTVTVEADEPGEEYNVDPGKFTLPALPKEMQSEIYAESSTPMVGGSSKKVKVVTEEDLKKAEEELLNELRNQAVNEFPQEDLIIIPDGAAIETLEYTPKPAKDEEAEKFKLKIKAKLSFLAFNEDDMLAVTRDDVHEVLPSEQFLLGGEETEISYEIVDENINNGTIEVYYHARKSFARLVDKDQVKQEISGLGEAEIKALLSKKEAVADVTIDFWPFWVKKAPTNINRIFVDISLN
ncbi:hypothetical protein ACFL0Z_00220 [Patescibacteria group bacterium]